MIRKWSFLQYKMRKNIIIFSLKKRFWAGKSRFAMHKRPQSERKHCQATWDACKSGRRCLYMSPFLLLPPYFFKNDDFLNFLIFEKYWKSWFDRFAEWFLNIKCEKNNILEAPCETGKSEAFFREKYDGMDHFPFVFYR